MWLLAMVILVWQRDLGTAMLFFIVFLLLLYLVSGDWRILLGGLLLVIVAGIAAYQFIDVVRLRVDIWLNPWPEADGRAYQIVQSLMAFGAGGIFGSGVGLGSPGYIPVAHSDFVFAAIAEEWGLLGVIGILSCLGVLAWRGLAIALSHPGAAFHRLLAVALTMTLLIQALMIMAGVLKLLPLTGVTLPFISYGGSSLLACHIMIGSVAAAVHGSALSGHLARNPPNSSRHAGEPGAGRTFGDLLGHQWRGVPAIAGRQPAHRRSPGAHSARRNLRQARALAGAHQRD